MLEDYLWTVDLEAYGVGSGGEVECLLLEGVGEGIEVVPGLGGSELLLERRHCPLWGHDSVSDEEEVLGNLFLPRFSGFG